MSKNSMCFAPGSTAAQAAPVHTVDGVRRVSSQALLGTSGQLVIEHHGRLYRLRVTQNDKLILTA